MLLSSLLLPSGIAIALAWGLQGVPSTIFYKTSFQNTDNNNNTNDNNDNNDNESSRMIIMILIIVIVIVIVIVYIVLAIVFIALGSFEPGSGSPAPRGSHQGYYYIYFH